MKKKKRLYPLLSLMLLLSFLLYRGNNALDITTFELPSDELSGLRILHLSDLHNKSFGKNQEKIIKKINEIKPDLIVFTGDLVDARRKGHQNSLTLMDILSRNHTVYRVNGNHDYSDNGYALKPTLDELHIITLENACDTYYYNDIPVQIKGVDDPISYDRASRETEFKNS